MIKKEKWYLKLVDFIRQNKVDLLITVIFFIFPFIFFKDTFNLREIIFGSEDSIRYYIPTRALVIDSIKSGSMPFWNPYIFGGFPLLATPDIYAFYPPALILDLIFPIPLSYNLLVIFQYSLSGILMYFFLNEYKLNKLASFVGALVFMFSGNMISHRSLSVYLNVFTWAPLILLFLEKFRKSKRFEFLLLASLFLSISFFGGAQQLFIYLSIMIALFIFYYSFIYNPGKNLFFLWAFIMFIFVILVGSIQLIPTFELVNNSFARSSVDYNYMTIDSYNIKLLPSIIFPYIFGCKHNSITGIPSMFRWMGHSDSVNMIRYFGITTIPFFLIGLTKKNKHVFFWIFILISSFIFTLGKFTPLYKIFLYIPIINKFKIPTRIFFIFGFALAIIIAFGFNEFIKSDKTKIRSRIITSILVISFIFTGFFIFYYILKYTNFQANILSFFSTTINVENLLSNIQLRNFAIYTPLIFLFITLIFLIFSLFRKNKFTYIIIIILIFLDLFFMGHFDENNRKNIYFLNNKTNTTENELTFLKNDSENYRILLLEQEPEKLLFSPNRNIYYKQEQLLGYDPLIIKEFSNLFSIYNYGTMSHEEGLNLLRNNNLISAYNTKYIIVPSIKDQKQYLNNLEKYDLDNKKIVLEKFNSEAEIENFVLDTEKNEIAFNLDNNQLKIYKKKLELKNNKDYLISFEIKGKALNNNIYFDFFGENYDKDITEVYINPNLITENYQYVSKYINSNNIPEHIDTYFRVFTYSKGEISIKNLKIYEISKISNYKIIYDDEKISVLENLNVLPKIYFANQLISVPDISAASDYIWERTDNTAEKHFNPKKNTIIESIENIYRVFNIQNNFIEILDYSNSDIVLNAKTSEESFLVFSDTNYSGWKAFIDDKETKIYNTNGIMKGIFIPEGNHKIEFKFIPKYFHIVLIISSISIIALLILILLFFFHKKIDNN